MKFYSQSNAMVGASVLKRENVKFKNIVFPVVYTGKGSGYKF
jgi:hypothetical protein